MTYQRKTLLLLGGIFVAGIFFYKVTIKKTFALSKQKTELLNQIKMAENAEEELIHVRTQLAHVEQLIGKSNMEGDKIQQELLNRINAFCKENKCRVSEVKKTHTATESNFEIITNIFDLEGDFKTLLTLVNELERNFDEGRLASLVFHKEKNRITRKEKLYMTFYIQNIRHEK